MGLWQRTATNVGWTTLSQAFTVGLCQIVLLVLASILSPRDFGVYAACAVVNTVLVQLSTFGLDYAVVNSEGDWRRVVSTGTLLRITLSVVGIGVVIILAGWLSEFFEIDNLELPMILASSAALVIALAFPPQMELTKNLRFRQLSISRIFGSITWSVVALLLASIGWSYWSLIIASVSSQLAILVGVFLLSSQGFTVGFEKQTGRKLLRFGGVTTAGLFLVFLAGNLDKFVVGALKGPELFGIYWAMYIYGTFAPSWLTGVINTVMFPTYSILREKPDSLRRAYSDTLRYVSNFSAPISMGLAGGSSLFVLVLLGERWEEGVASLTLLSIAGYFMSMTSPAGNVFISIGKPELIFRITLAFLVPMVPLLILAGFEYGIVGVSAVILGHESAKCLYVIHRAGHLTGINASTMLKSILPSVAAGVLAGLIVLATYELIGVSALALVLAGALGALTYLVAGNLFSKGMLLVDIREGIRAIRNR